MSQMNENHVLMQKVTKGTLLVFIGNSFHLILVFVSYALIARYISKEDFGYLSISLGVSMVLSMLCCLGSEKSLPTFKPNKLQTNSGSTLSEGILSSFVFNCLLAVMVSLFLFYFAEQISILYKMPRLAMPLKIMAFAIPFMTLATLMVGYLQRNQDVWGKMIQDSLSPFIRVVLIVGAILTQLTFSMLLWFHVISFLIVALLLVTYARRRMVDFRFSWTGFEINRQLLMFSLPFFFVGMLTVLILWLDIFLLGFFCSPEEVAAYATGNRLVRLMPLIYSAFAFIYLPITFQLYAQEKLEEIRKLYALIAKWIYALTLPLFIVYFVTPNEIMNLCFGAKYAHDNLYFQVLCLGFLFFVLVGLSDITIIASGYTWVLLGCLIVNVVGNVGLDLILIPKYGKMGAAISSTTSFALANLLCAIFVYRRFMIHAFRKDNLKLILFTIPIIIAAKLVKEYGIYDFTILGVVLFSIILLPLSFFVTKNFSNDDIMLYKMIRLKITKKKSLP
jgi:O-antigen/teichoic acid export membrane protein